MLKRFSNAQEVSLLDVDKYFQFAMGIIKVNDEHSLNTQQVIECSKDALLHCR
jgi:hypothetical protein